MKKSYSKSQINTLKKRETEYWIYSYSDLITNLLALFIMMLIIQTGGKKKQEALQQGIDSYIANKIGKEQTSTTAPAGSLDEIKQIASKFLADQQLDKRVSLFETKSGLSFSFEGALLFDLGTAELQPEALEILKHISWLIQKLPKHYRFEVEGHADNKPVTSGNFPSNWELSSARAGSVVRYLNESGIDARRMRAIGYADTKPLDKTGSSPLNRRVILHIDARTSEDRP